MTTMNVPLSESMKEFVENQARIEGFETPSEYLHSLVREAQKKAARATVEALLREGLESGPASPLTSEEWDAIEREGLELAAARKRHKA